MRNKQTHASECAAADFIAKQVLAHPHQVTVVAIGALSNVALAIAREPKVVELMRELVFMGAGISHDQPPIKLASMQRGVRYTAHPNLNVKCDTWASKLGDRRSTWSLLHACYLQCFRASSACA